MVPGIEPSEDPVLQSRLFSYPDTHRHRLGTNYQQLPVNLPRTAYPMGNFQRDGPMAFFNQGGRPNYLSSIDPVQFKDRKVNLDKVHADFVSNAVVFLSTIRPEDFNAPRALWEKVYNDEQRARFIENMSGHMSTVKDKSIIERQIGIFRAVSEDLASRLEKATGVKGLQSLKGVTFNGSHNGMGDPIPANNLPVSSCDVNGG
jgi:catalase